MTNELLNCEITEGIKKLGSVFVMGTEETALKIANENFDLIVDATRSTVDKNNVFFFVKKGDEVLSKYNYQEMCQKVGGVK